MEKLKQFIRFGIVGCSNTVIFYVIYLLILYMMSPLSLSWDYVVGNVVAFLISVFWSFYWNERFVFQIQNRNIQARLRALVKTYVSYGFSGLILNNVLSLIWVNVFDIDKRIVPIINLIITVPVNFIMNKLWAFKE